MNRFALAAALLALAGGAASAQNSPMLSSAAQVTLATLAPNVDEGSLSPIQISRINSEVNSDQGLSVAQIRTIVAN